MKYYAVVNKCYGGFGVSKKAVEYMAEKGDPEAQILLKRINDGKCGTYRSFNKWDRDNLLLVDAVRTLGEEADGECSKLKIVEMEIQIKIKDYDGMETAEITGFESYY